MEFRFLHGLEQKNSNAHFQFADKSAAAGRGAADGSLAKKAGGLR